MARADIIATCTTVARSSNDQRARVILLAALGLFISGYNNFIIGLALLQLRPEFHLAPSSSGAVAAGTLAGMLVGALTLGRLADRLGRRPALWLDLTLVVVFALTCAVVQSPTELVIARFLLGTGIGAGYPIGASFVADVSPARWRGRLMTLAFAGWGVGAFCAALIGWLVLREPTGGQGWRLMLASGAAPALLALLLIGIARLPESPRWAGTRDKPAMPVQVLLQRPLRRLTMAATLPWFLMDLSVYGVGLYTPTILLSLGFHSPPMVAVGTVLLSIFTLAGFAGAAAVIDRVGRRPLQIIGFLAMAITLVGIAFTGTHPSPVLLLGLFGGFQVGSNMGPNTTTWIVPAELFPTRLRATGQGSATAFSRLGAVAGVLGLPLLVVALGLRTTLMLAAASSLLGMTLTIGLLPETAARELVD
ncbi:MAG: MFS transporter [Candidatus Dormibacteraeota bacterium]|nr:MFS transporter [Candidatus Dormibacteraeota bacterium]